MLSDLKEYLNISYDDAATDAVLMSAIERGKSVLDGYAGTPQDYESEGLPRQLLFDYCRYVRSHAAEMFEPNFRHDLIMLREMAEIEKLKDAQTEEQNENKDTNSFSDI